MKRWITLLPLLGLANVIGAQKLVTTKIDSLVPVRGLCIAAPSPARIDDFVKFIHNELASRTINLLLVRIDYNYQYESHKELIDGNALSKKDVKKLVEACKAHHIRLIPQINLLGHQSWGNTPGKLLQVYPEFDETPYIEMPSTYQWPNSDRLYCKSYCPLHPQVHKIIFEVIDEICDVFESDGFHGGMDEVFYLGEDKCPRCGGRDKAELFANEVRTIHDHLALKNRQLFIWGDRLIDGKTTGLGEWEASFNNTYRAVDMIPKDVTICDWHYDRADKTPVYFAVKGLNVVTCPYHKAEVVTNQLKDILNFRQQSSPEMKARFQGIIQTVWTDADGFMDAFYGRKPEDKEANNTVNCFKVLYEEVLKIK